MRKRSEINNERKISKKYTLFCYVLCAILYIRLNFFLLFLSFARCVRPPDKISARCVLFHLHCHVQHAPSTLNLALYEQNEIFPSCKFTSNEEAEDGET